jgi:hypothetical protein
LFLHDTHAGTLHRAMHNHTAYCLELLAYTTYLVASHAGSSQYSMPLTNNQDGTNSCCLLVSPLFFLVVCILFTVGWLNPDTDITTAQHTVSSNKISLLTVIANNKNNRKTSNKQEKKKTDRGEHLLEPTVLPGASRLPAGGRLACGQV